VTSSDFVRPRYGEASLADVVPGVFAALGVPGRHDPLGLSTGLLAEARVVTVLLLDGFGDRLLPLAAPYAPTITDLAAGRIQDSSARSLTTGFPSTTPTSLASLTTGAAPGAHGLLGFFLNVPGTDRVLNHIRWHSDPDPLRWQPLDTQFQVARLAGVAVHVVSKPEFADSGLTMAAFRGGDYVGAADPDALAGAILARMHRADRPTMIYGYHPDVDSVGHMSGVDSLQWRDAVRGVDRLVSRLVDGLPAGGALVITADHGQINVPRRHRFDLDLDPRLRAGVRVIAGEARVRYLHTVDGASDDVLATWRGVLGDAAWVVSREEAVADGWFGPVPDEHLQRVGDVVVACHGDYVVIASQTDPPGGPKVAFHGSATEAEMMIPLLIVRRY
jgi:hypothetical protein